MLTLKFSFVLFVVSCKSGHFDLKSEIFTPVNIRITVFCVGTYLPTYLPTKLRSITVVYILLLTV
jgi:hypothetical protein